MTSPANDISVIICTYSEGRWDGLMSSVGSVQQQTLPPKEIIIVIDHNPRLLKKVEEQVSGVLVVENSEVRGLSGARNSGIAVAQGKVIAFLDDDAIAMPDWLKSLSESFSDAQMLGCGGAVVPLWLEEAPEWFPEEFYWVVGCTYRGMPQSVGSMRNPIGANMCFRREVFESIGGFRSGIGRIGRRPLGGEETELCLRIRQYWAEDRLMYQPGAKVLHRVPSDRASLGYFCERCFGEGLSKAAVMCSVGSKGSLATEWRYSVHTLPKGVVRGLVDGLIRMDGTGLLRVGAIVVGLLFSIAGYVVGSIGYWGKGLKFPSINRGLTDVGKVSFYSSITPLQMGKGDGDDD
jgi:GT2 family glycosyltransferase